MLELPVTGAMLLAYMAKDDVLISEDLGLAEISADTATALVMKYLSGSFSSVSLTDELVAYCILIAASELFFQQQSPQGVAQFATPDTVIPLAPRDPLLRVYPLLQRFRKPGMA